MKAAINFKYGPPEVVSIKNVDKPVPKQNEVLVKVFASTVNRTDCGFRSAEYFISRFFSGLIRPKFHILGNEFAGVIEETGQDVSSFNIGDRVFGYNDKTFGAHAEYMVLSVEDPISSIPGEISFSEAAPISEGGHYALCDIRAAKVKSGQNCLVYGATGAIGSAAVQLLKHIGARVTAVCDTKHMELVGSIGADEVIDYTRQDYTLTDQRFHFVFDAVGKSSFSACKKILHKNGIYISTELGAYAANVFLALITPLFRGRKVLFPIPSISRNDIEFLKGLIEGGVYKPLIDREYSLDQIVEAYRYVETGQKIGNVVINIVNLKDELTLNSFTNGPANFTGEEMRMNDNQTIQHKEL